MYSEESLLYFDDTNEIGCVFNTSLRKLLDTHEPLKKRIRVLNHGNQRSNNGNQKSNNGNQRSKQWESEVQQWESEVQEWESEVQQWE